METKLFVDYKGPPEDWQASTPEAGISACLYANMNLL
jgi:hypothetical protein